MNHQAQITRTLKAVMFSIIGTAFALGIVLGAFLIAPGNRSNDAVLASVSETPSPEKVSATSADSIELEEDFELPVPSAGESLYYGQADYDEASKFLMAFILSADGSEIHDIVIYVKDLNITVSQLQLSGMTITVSYDAAYPVGTDSTDIDLGSSKLNGLVIQGDYASGEIDYVYTYYTNTDTIDVPLGKKAIEFKNITDSITDDAVASSSPTAAASVPGGDTTAYMTFEDSNYSVTIGDIGLSENGYTTVTINSPGIGEVLPFREGNFVIPVQMMIVTGGETIGWNTVTTATDSLTFEFLTDKTPEQIILYPYGGEEDESTHVVFDAQTNTILP